MKKEDLDKATTTTSGFYQVQYPEELTKKIDIVIKALGTMVIEPQLENHPTEIGKKINMGGIQRPIIQGNDRILVEKKLLSLIEGL